LFAAPGLALALNTAVWVAPVTAAVTW